MTNVPAEGTTSGSPGSGGAFCNTNGGLSTSRVNIDNVYPCANPNINDAFGYQCAEFSVRFESAHHSEPLVSGPGRDVVTNLHNRDGVPIDSPASGHLPAPGDVISMWGDANQDRFGHTGVVAAVNVTNGNGTITIYDENGIFSSGLSTGVSTVAVNNWHLSVSWKPPFHYTYFNWTVQA